MRSLPRYRRRRLLGFCAVSWHVAAGTWCGGVLAADAAPPLILLDPGHGGRDNGATGVAGTLEKHVVLDTAMVLKDALEAGGRYRVAMTRSADRFLPLDDRVAQAEAMKPSLFLSLHADKAPDPTLRGASVYTLAKQASDSAAEGLAARENQGARPGGKAAAGLPPGVSDILAALAAEAVKAESFRVAHRLVRDLEKDVLVLPSPQRHANFAVLRAAGIPSVLVEMGFLSNAADEASLRRQEYRATVTGAMTRAIDAWFARTG